MKLALKNYFLIITIDFTSIIQYLRYFGEIKQRRMEINKLQRNPGFAPANKHADRMDNVRAYFKGTPLYLSKLSLYLSGKSQ